jgi:hypothetical protein
LDMIYEREMTITHKDFLRLLPKAISGLDYQRNGDQIEIDDAGRSVRINLSKESSRKIASLALPLTNVRIELKNFSQSELTKFMSRFDLAYQKGGG